MKRDYQFDRSLGMLSRQISKGIGKNLQKHFDKNGIDLDPIAWSVISLLKKRPDRTQQEIVHFLWIDKVKVTRVIDKLETAGLVKRKIQEADKRYNVVSLTDKGRLFFDKVVSYAEDTLTKAFAGFSEEQQQQLIDFLVRVKQNLESDVDIEREMK